MNKVSIEVGAKLKFDGKKTPWLVRAVTKDRRYAIATRAMFGNVHYTIIDTDDQVRGAMNVIGGGLGIYTASGPDEDIDEAIGMLENDGYEVSRRNRVPLAISQ